MGQGKIKRFLKQLDKNIKDCKYFSNATLCVRGYFPPVEINTYKQENRSTKDKI